MADDNTIIEGTVNFRDGKKWKSRWCVMRKLSPVADCVHLQLYRDARGRWARAGCKAALSLQHYLGCELGFTLDKHSNTLALVCRDLVAVLAFETRERLIQWQHYLGCELGFTLDKHSNTLALVCRDLVAVLAFETRERLIQWQVKVSAHLGEPRHYLVLVGAAAGGAGGGKARLPAGPARLHLHSRRFALTAGVPPRLLGVWELPHLRRYGVVEGRFCFEGGSYCGKGEGLHVLITDQAKEIAVDFDLASQGRLSPKRRPLNSKKTNGAESPISPKAYRPDTRLSELNTIERTLPPADCRPHEDPRVGEDTGAISPYWPSAERTHFHDMGLGDTASVNETVEGADTAPWSAAGAVALERCRSCMSKLGALSRSSTAALTPGAKHFSPAWTMDALEESFLDTGSSAPAVSTLSVAANAAKLCRRPERQPPAPAPDRPPKPTRLELDLGKKPPMPPPAPPQTCTCPRVRSTEESKSSKIGPYENYDVPKLASVEIDDKYYDTPKRLKECLNNELFKITKSCSSNAVVLKKPCGCLLTFGKRRKEPTVVDSEESLQPASCPCARVTDWANNWIGLPYCKKNTASSDNLVPNKENVKPNFGDRNAIYATIDVSRKTRRKTHPIDPDELDYSIDPHKVEIDRGPLANYENLNFALSLEYYENAKDLLRRAGVTQAELDAIGANLRAGAGRLPAPDPRARCADCGHPPRAADTDGHLERLTVTTSDDYLMMEPNSSDGNRQDQCRSLPSGYTPMSPIGGFAFDTLKYPARSPINRLLEEKSASNPTLGVPTSKCNSNGEDAVEGRPSRSSSDGDRYRIEYRKRSSSADSSRFLEDVKEFESGAGADGRGSSSSIETLRDADLPPAGAAWRCAREHKHSDADSSEASKGCGSGAGAQAAGGTAPGNRDSSSSNDSGVSSCSLRPAAGEFELPLTTAAARRHYRCARRAGAASRGTGAGPPRRSRSTDPLRDGGGTLPRERVPAKSSSAEAEVPVLAIIKPLKGVADTHSTSSGTSDMSDYIETLSICSSHSSTDTPITMRVVRQTSTLRPRSGKEYGSLAPHLGAACRACPGPGPAGAPPPARPPHRPRAHLYSNLT